MSYPLGQNSKSKVQNHSSKGKGVLRLRCYEFSVKLIQLIDGFPNSRSYWIIGDQLLRSGTSIGANVTEASSASSKLEFKKFFEIALKSANESIYWLNLLKDTNKVARDEIEPLIEEVGQLSNMLAKSVMTLKGKTSF